MTDASKGFVAIVDLNEGSTQIGEVFEQETTQCGIYKLRWLGDSEQAFIHYHYADGGFGVTLYVDQTRDSIYEDPRELMFHFAQTREDVQEWAEQTLAA